VNRFATRDAGGPLDVRLFQRCALPAHPNVARRVASVLLKMQVKHRLLSLEERARNVVSRSRE
jgi:hypothetical protein